MPKALPDPSQKDESLNEEDSGNGPDTDYLSLARFRGNKLIQESQQCRIRKVRPEHMTAC